MATPFILPPVYPILDTASLDRVNFGALEAAEALLEGGAQILQFRHKAFWSRETFAQAEEIAGLCARAGVPFVVNDRADYAATHRDCKSSAPGLDFISARKISRRRCAPSWGGNVVIGFSTHNLAQARGG